MKTKEFIFISFLALAALGCNEITVTPRQNLESAPGQKQSVNDPNFTGISTEEVKGRISELETSLASALVTLSSTHTLLTSLENSVNSTQSQITTASSQLSSSQQSACQTIGGIFSGGTCTLPPLSIAERAFCNTFGGNATSVICNIGEIAFASLFSDQAALANIDFSKNALESISYEDGYRSCDLSGSIGKFLVGRGAGAANNLPFTGMQCAVVAQNKAGLSQSRLEFGRFDIQEGNVNNETFTTPPAPGFPFATAWNGTYAEFMCPSGRFIFGFDNAPSNGGQQGYRCARPFRTVASQSALKISTSPRCIEVSLNENQSCPNEMAVAGIRKLNSRIRYTCCSVRPEFWQN